jgi:hypothetical protein
MIAGGALFVRVLALLETWQWDTAVDRDASDGIGRALLEPFDTVPAWPLMLAVHEEARRVLFYSIWPEPVPARYRPGMTDALARVNDGLISGAAEMSIDDGDLRVRTSAAFGHAEPSDDILAAVVAESLDDNLSLAGRYFPAFRAIITDGAAPAQAVALAESGQPHYG